MRLDGVHGNKDHGWNDQILHSARGTRLVECQPDERKAQRIKQQPRQRRSEIVMPRGNAPIGGRTQHGIVVKARELWPQGLLPKVRVNGDGEAERGDEGGEKEGDELAETEVGPGESEEPCCGEKNGQFGAEDGCGEDEQGNCLATASSFERDVIFGEQECRCQSCL